MNITTDSIREFLIDSFDKDIDDLLISDSLLVEFITVDGLDYDGNKLNVDFSDLKYFKNLRFIEIANTMVNSSLINILSTFNRLENVIFRNCTYSKSLRNFNKLTNIKCLRVIEANNFDLNYIKDLTTLKRLYISNMDINSLKVLSKLNLDALDVSSCNIKRNCFKSLNVKYLVISEDLFNKYTESLLNLDCKVMIMGDESLGYFISKWIN